MKKLALTTIVMSLVLSACSSNSNKDVNQRESEMLQQTASQKEALFAPLAGQYYGELKKPDGAVRKVSLILVPSIIIVQNPGRNDVSEIPTLAGGLNLLTESADGNSSIIPIAQYTSAKFDSDSKRIRMSGAISSIGGSMGNILNTLDGVFYGDRIVARLTNTTIGDVGTLTVQRLDK